MDIQKWGVIAGLGTALTMFCFAMLIEWDIINISLFIEHKDFIINAMLGVSASAITSSIISYVFYEREKKKIIKKYLEILGTISADIEFFVEVVNECKENGMMISEDGAEYFKIKITNMCNLLKDVFFIGMDYSPAYLPWERDELNLCQSHFHWVCNNTYHNLILIYEYMNREKVMRSSNTSKMITDECIIDSLEDIIRELGNGSEFNECSRLFQEMIIEYLNLKEPNI